MKKLRFLLTAALFFCFPPLVCLTHGDEENVNIDTQVVAVFATQKDISYLKPWKSPNFRAVRGSGFFFQDEERFPGLKGLILTNAHVVAMAQKVEISNGKEKRRYVVSTVGICNLADFAVLQLSPSEIKAYERRNGPIVPLKLGDSDTLRVGDKVLGWGYPLGGERISKSEQGEINRIEVRRYAYSFENWLMVQASLQQNPGNSGGPILKDDMVVGIAFQGVMASDRINYFIPINLVRHLLPVLHEQERIPRWRYFVQEMSTQLKEHYRVPPEHGGVLLNAMIPGGGPETFGLRADDVLLEVDGHPIDGFGDISFSPLGQRVYFEEVINRKIVGDALAFKVLRSGKVHDVKGTVTAGLPFLVPKIFDNPNFFIYGGIGFVELTTNAIADLGKSAAALREQYLRNLPEQPYEKVVIVAEIFPEYEVTDPELFLMERVEKVNNEEILNMEHFFRLIASLKKAGEKKILVKVPKNRQLPLDLEKALALDEKIKRKYAILYMQTPGGFSK